MIFIGYDDAAKRSEIERYCAAHGLTHIVVISADEFPLTVDGAHLVKYSDVIMYATFYPLLQEIGRQTLVVVNECLRTQNRYDLAYNCIRNYLNQTKHQLIFQQLPQIDAVDDFMVLFDWDTRSRWKRRPFDPDLIARESQVTVRRLPIGFTSIAVPTSDRTKAKYAQERNRLFRELGPKDPHTLPRNLYLIGGEDKAAYIRSQALPLFAATGPRYVARNQRLKVPGLLTYETVEPPPPYTLVELPHRFIDYADFVRRTGQFTSEVLVADLKVDEWYFDRYRQWSERIHATYASLSQ